MAQGRVSGFRFFLMRLGDLLSDRRRLLGALRWLVVRSPPVICGSYLRSLTRRRGDFVEERWSGLQDLSAAGRIAVFSHYDAGGRVHDFVAYYLRQLGEAGFAVVFVSNSPRLPQETIERLRPSCGLILRRANVGYDFGAFKDGIARIPDCNGLERLLLVNDSVYGPFHPLREVLAGMDRSAEVWGITDSGERHPHLQSYFLLFHPAAVRSEAFARFWTRLRPVTSKEWAIANCEIGLTRALAAGGLRCRALCPSSTAAADFLKAVEERGLLRAAGLEPVRRRFVRRVHAAASRGVALNSMHYFWDYLIERGGCPFLKRELLRDNPLRIPGVGSWEEVVRSSSAYDTGLILRHRESTAPGRPVPDPLPPGRAHWSWYA
jgi:lipopolysaccharide biosynthesis protein